jgi:hypothetical protein
MMTGHKTHDFDEKSAPPMPDNTEFPRPPSRDFLERARRSSWLVPPGSYSVALVPRDIQLTRTRQTESVSFVVRIMEGELEGREVPLRLMIDGPRTVNSIIGRDLKILTDWADSLGVEEAESAVQLLQEFGRQGQRQGRRIEMTFAHREAFVGGVEIAIVEVKVEPKASSE